MDSGIVLGILFFGVAIGALLESVVRIAFRQKLEEEFVDKLKKHVSLEDSTKG